MLSSPSNSEESSSVLAVGFSSLSMPPSPTYDRSPMVMQNIKVLLDSSPIMAVGFSDSGASSVYLSSTEQQHNSKNCISLH